MKSFKSITAFAIAVSFLGIADIINAQMAPLPVRPALDIPNISVIGLVNGTFSRGQTASLSVDEVEFAFQNVIFPGVRADVFAALHK